MRLGLFIPCYIDAFFPEVGVATLELLERLGHGVVVRASFAVAETGSVLLSEADLHVNAIAYLAQHLIVLLDPADIVVNLHHGYRRPEFRDRHYASFHTDPSTTADIEGVLIHGAQGVRSLSVLPLARSAGNPTQ
jgi:L-lactate dehydrogenase complex protein LldG